MQSITGWWTGGSTPEAAATGETMEIGAPTNFRHVLGNSTLAGGPVAQPDVAPRKIDAKLLSRKPESSSTTKPVGWMEWAFGSSSPEEKEIEIGEPREFRSLTETLPTARKRSSPVRSDGRKTLDTVHSEINDVVKQALQLGYEVRCKGGTDLLGNVPVKLRKGEAYVGPLTVKQYLTVAEAAGGKVLIEDFPIVIAKGKAYASSVPLSQFRAMLNHIGDARR